MEKEKKMKKNKTRKKYHANHPSKVKTFVSQLAIQVQQGYEEIIIKKWIVDLEGKKHILAWNVKSFRQCVKSRRIHEAEDVDSKLKIKKKQGGA